MKTMRETNRPTYFKKSILFSILLHFIVLGVFIGSFEWSAPAFVVANDVKVVNAVALMDSPILAPLTKVVETKSVPVPPKPLSVDKPAIKPIPLPSAATAALSKAALPDKKIAIPDKQKKHKQVTQEMVLKQNLNKQLMADLDSEISKQVKVKHQLIKEKFSKELKIQSGKAVQKMMQEEKHTASGQQQRMQGVVDKYKSLILQAIGQQWIVPSDVDKKLYCELLIHLTSGGVVLGVVITKSSGNVLLDNSARAAVFKASPLPVPDDGDSFKTFRQFVLKVKPENVLEN